MINQKGVKISLLICLSIILILSIITVILGIVALIATDHIADQQLKDTVRIFVIIITVIEGIDVVIQILGIVATSRDHNCGSLSFTIYQGISLLLVIFNLIAFFSVITIFSLILLFIFSSLILKITILPLCIIYVRQLRQSQTTPNSRRQAALEDEPLKK